MAADRSARREVRNPVLGLPAFKAIQQLPAAVRHPLRRLLLDLAADARQRAQHCWDTHKPPMAV